MFGNARAAILQAAGFNIVNTTAPEVIHSCHSRTPARTVAIHLVSKQAGLTEKGVGVTFGDGACAVSKVAARVARTEKVDRKLRRLLRRLGPRRASPISISCALINLPILQA